MANESPGGNLENGDLSQGDLTPEQRVRLQIVNARLEDTGDVNPNLADTPAHLAEHGFKWLNGRPHGTR